VVHPSAADSRGSDSAGSDLAGAEPAGHVQPRRLEQHFVYNSLNTIAALIRTDPARARELLFGFADLSRAADRPGESTLARELDAVRGYLQLEQARFGPRLQVAVDVESGLELVPVGAMAVLDVVRRAVQQGIEPLLGGGLLVVVVRRTGEGCAVTVSAGGRQPTTLLFPAGPV
jgi:LytS/YehU family sensor histidine kinase